MTAAILTGMLGASVGALVIGLGFAITAFI